MYEDVPGKNRETKSGIIEQFDRSIANNENTLLDGYAHVFYLDRSQAGIVEMKSMWFDDNKTAIERSVEILNVMKASAGGQP